MARPWDTISEPVQLRRADGSSVYTQAGADLFTSSKVLAAEQRLVDAAGRHDGYAVEASRSEEHTSELQSLMRISYAVFCLKKKKSDSVISDEHSHEHQSLMRI